MLIDVLRLISSYALVFTSLTWLRAQDVTLKGIEEVEIGALNPGQDIDFFSHVMGLTCSGVRCSVGDSQQLTFVASTERRGTFRSITLASDDPAEMRKRFIRNHVAVGKLQRDELGAVFFSLLDLDGNRLLVRNGPANPSRVSGQPVISPIAHHVRHVAIPVKSLEAAEAFYVKQLGFRVVGRTYRQGKPGWINVAMGEATGDFLQLAFVESGRPQEDASTVEHICFDVADAYATRQAIALRIPDSKGLRAPVIGLAKFRKLMIEAPDGLPLELMETVLAIQKAGEHVE